MRNHAARCLLLITVAASRAQAQESPVEAAAPASSADGASRGAAAAAASPGALADPADASTVDPSRTQARDAFRLGSTLARQGQWMDALAAFARSAELHPHPVTTYNIGYVERALGRLTRARKYLLLALEPGGSSETLPEDLAALSRGYLAEIDRRLVRVAVLVPSAEVAIAIDGRPLEATSVEGGERPLLVAGTLPAGPAQRAPAATFDLLIDPGNHVILVSAAGKPDRVLTTNFAQGATESLRLEEAETRGPTPAAPATAPERDQPPVEVSERTDLTPWMWTAFGVGAAGLITGAVFGALALDKDSKLDKACGPSRDDCPPEYRMDIEQLELYAPAADIALIGGSLAVATGAVLWFFERRGSSGERSSVKVQAGPRSGWVSVSGTF
jgi:hypothetical protein